MTIRKRGRKWVGLLTQLAFTAVLTAFITRRLSDCSIAWWDAALMALAAMAVGAVAADAIAW